MLRAAAGDAACGDRVAVKAKASGKKTAPPTRPAQPLLLLMLHLPHPTISTQRSIATGCV